MEFWDLQFHSYYFILMIPSLQIYLYYFILLIFTFYISSLNNSDYHIHPSQFHMIISHWVWNWLEWKIKDETCQDEMLILKVRMKNVGMKCYIYEIVLNWWDEIVKRGTISEFLFNFIPIYSSHCISSRRQKWSPLFLN